MADMVVQSLKHVSNVLQGALYALETHMPHALYVPKHKTWPISIIKLGKDA